MKYIIIIPDGMFDNPIKSLGDKTPLEVAHTVNMDYMASHGAIGQVQTIPDKMHPGSDIGNMAILGYDPKTYHTGRAPLEAANQNIILKDNQIAFRCNLITTQNDTMADYSAGHISTKEASILIDALNKELASDSVRFYLGKSYRHLLLLTVENPDEFMAIKTLAPHDILGKSIKYHLPKGKNTEILLTLMEKAKTIFQNQSVNQVRVDLGENPADGIWLWGQGKRPNLPPFKKLFGVDGSIISAVDLVCGIGRLAGLQILDVPGITGYYDTNYLGKAQYAIDSLKTRDFVYIHIEAPDEAGHNGDIKAKIAAIENIDKNIVGTILNHYDEHADIRILLLPDHPTPVEIRTHTSDPVGFIMYGKGVKPDGAEEYNEKTCKEKGMKFANAGEMINYFMKK